MKRWMHKIEHIVDKLIVPMLLLLIVIIVLDLGFPEIAHHYHTYILIGDYLVITVFILDLVFKWIRVKNIPIFFRKYWLDILAVFPFFILFRAFEGFAGLMSLRFTEGAQTVQSMVHTGLEVEKEGVKVAEVVTKEGGKMLEGTAREVARIAREAEKIGKFSRSSRFARFIRPIFRSPRFLKVLPFYEKPTGTHHIHEYYHPKPKKTTKKSVSKKK
ncbi:hypothetical protein ACFL0V_03315 [Nanoarchaeota archaeon]